MHAWLLSSVDGAASVSNVTRVPVSPDCDCIATDMGHPAGQGRRMRRPLPLLIGLLIGAAAPATAQALDTSITTPAPDARVLVDASTPSTLHVAGTAHGT